MYFPNNPLRIRNVPVILCETEQEFRDTKCHLEQKKIYLRIFFENRFEFVIVNDMIYILYLDWLKFFFNVMCKKTGFLITVGIQDK